jgi:hypothetical protein
MLETFSTIRKPRLVIIGAGPAGIHAAALAEGAGFAVTVIEKRSSVGGRVRTAMSGANQAQYELGAWRVPITHTQILSMSSGWKRNKLVDNKRWDRAATCETSDGLVQFGGDDLELSPWTRNALLQSVNQAIACDWSSSFPGTATGLASTHGAGREAMYTLPGGLQPMWHRKGLHLTDVRTSLQVMDVERVKGPHPAWKVHVDKGPPLVCDYVLVAVPPWQWNFPAVQRLLQPAAALISAHQLCHTYMRVTGTGPLGYELDLLGTLYKHAYPDKTYNLHSYTSGSAALAVARLSTTLNRVEVQQLMERFLRQRGWTTCNVHEVKVCNNEMAIAQWKAPLPKAVTTARLAAKSIIVNPVEAPGLFVAGEAFSTTQGWMQGAVESAAAAVKVICSWRNGRSPSLVSVGDLTENMIVIGHRVVDITNFAQKHPGGAAAFDSFRGGKVNAQTVFSHIHSHLSAAQREVFLRTVGYVNQRVPDK